MLQFPYQVKAKLVVPSVIDAQNGALTKPGGGAAVRRFDDCLDAEMEADLIKTAGRVIVMDPECRNPVLKSELPFARFAVGR